MSKYLIEFVMKKSMVIEANGIEDAMHQSITWINHDEFREEHQVKDMGFYVVGIRTLEQNWWDYGPRSEK